MGFGAAIAGWWYYSRLEATTTRPERGELIFSNTPWAN